MRQEQRSRETAVEAIGAGEKALQGGRGDGGLLQLDRDCGNDARGDHRRRAAGKVWAFGTDQKCHSFRSWTEFSRSPSGEAAARSPKKLEIAQKKRERELDV